MKKRKTTIQSFKKRLTQLKKNSNISDDRLLSSDFDTKKLQLIKLLNKCYKIPSCKEQIIKDLVTFQLLVNKCVRVIKQRDSDPILVKVLQKQILSSMESLLSVIERKMQ